jgi:hypothetical protein
MFRLVMFTFFLVVAGQYSLAQDAIATATPLEDKVNDHLDGSAKAAGGRLVGLSLTGTHSKKFDPSNVQITMPIERKPVICVRGISRDGLYWTRTPYNSPSAQENRHEVKLSPFTSAYERQLRSYDNSDVAILAFEASDANCFDKGAQIMPVLDGSARDLRIKVQVNTGNQHVKITLRHGATEVEGVCNPVRDRERIAFDRDCSVPVTLSAAPEIATLVLTFDDGLVEEEDPYTVFLPPKD